MGMVKERKAKYFGHVKRHQSLMRDLLEGKVKGTRLKGKSRTTWEGKGEMRKWSRILPF